MGEWVAPEGFFRARTEGDGLVVEWSLGGSPSMFRFDGPSGMCSGHRGWTELTWEDRLLEVRWIRLHEVAWSVLIERSEDGGAVTMVNRYLLEEDRTETVVFRRAE